MKIFKFWVDEGRGNGSEQILVYADNAENAQKHIEYVILAEYNEDAWVNLVDETPELVAPCLITL